LTSLVGTRVHVTGVVQGVGYRPFVFALAERHDIAGWVRNTSAGVDIEVEGTRAAVERFVADLQADAPPLARIDEVTVKAIAPKGASGFKILVSQSQDGGYQPVSPDVATCDDCLREMRDPTDRRYRYPFINCTNCGPRFTIITDIPYDRPSTTMAEFEMCPLCAAEYSDPRDRRFHAQPIACPDCGPHVWLEPTDRSADVPEGATGAPRDDDAIRAARRLLAEGRIVAIKGLGGFHLACDAENDAAVAELRRRKLRVDKPFALMVRDVSVLERHCTIEDTERDLLTSQERPIVILSRRSSSKVAHEVSPDTTDLGLMLPYTPLHELLLEEDASDAAPGVLVMTSGNLSEEPIATDNDEARRRLAGLADALLLHDRPIRSRCDDSVVRTFEGRVYPLRRSRGYAPYPVELPWPTAPLLAAGAELKNTFCIGRDRRAFMSHHIGDMENYETLVAFEDGVAHYERLFRISPQALAYDLHPDYLATRLILERAEREGLPAVGVQHHHAHIASCMIDNGLRGDEPVIGLSFDGTGYGDDGAIWGGEVLLADYGGYVRLMHLDYVPMPGGDLAVHEPWRLALAWLRRAGIAWDDDLPPVRSAGSEGVHVVSTQIERGVNAPPTSSMGRLFDAVSSLAGIRECVNYEAQAAIALEQLVDRSEGGSYELTVAGHIIDASPAIAMIVEDVRSGASASRVATRFHRAVADAACAACVASREDTGAARVALSGGVWQNMTLLEMTVERLRRSGFEVLLHRQVPTNDGGLALGQLAVASRWLELSSSH
jgi:hydrogenase maturation protein HypF